MEEKNNSQANSSKDNRSQTEIDALLQEMIKKETSPAAQKSDKSPLDNLKGILLQVDQVANPKKEIIVKQNIGTPVAISRKTENTNTVLSEAPAPNKKAASTLEPDPVKKLNELIKSYRASKR